MAFIIFNKPNTNNIPTKSALSVKWVISWKMQKKITKGHNYVKNTIIKNPKSHAHRQILANILQSFKSIESKSSESYGEEVEISKGHNSTKNDKNKNKKTHAHLDIIIKQAIKVQIKPAQDVGGFAGTRFRTEGRTETYTDGQRSFL